jgi:hypothetical protein
VDLVAYTSPRIIFFRFAVPGVSMIISADFSAKVAERPEVESVVIVAARRLRRFRIIHLCNWHMIPRLSFEGVLAAEGISPTEIHRRFQDHVARVESVQKEQYSLMLFLVDELELTAVHLEGLCTDDADLFQRHLLQLRDLRSIPHNGHHDLTTAENIREDLLLAGTAGQLSMQGILKILPVEDRTVFEAANPFKPGGEYADDPVLTEQRETKMVGHLIQDGAVTFVILGGLHDLSDKVPDDCEYVRIETKRYAQMMGTVRR